MPRQKDFKLKFASKVFAINPSFSFKESGCGWAIINCDAQSYGGNLNSPLVLKSGTIKPFTNLASLPYMIELAHKLERIWEEDSGFSSQPITVAIEKPGIDHGEHISQTSIRELGILVGILITTFSPQLIIVPAGLEWNSTAFKENTQKEIINSSDKISLSNISRDMACIALHNRHHVYNAIGLGIYGGHVTKKQLPLPETFFHM
jgi:hypothetical protein